jgi:hydroxymethylpyrimidine pyrophosphatase-like HAD family hydrolase
MGSDTPWKMALEKFALSTGASKSFLALDLDGTALLEDHGKVFISSSVEKGVKAIYDLKLPVILNTLRFPLSVISTIGEAWCQLADVPILTVLLNGSLLGHIQPQGGELVYQELAAYCMTPAEIAVITGGVEQLVKAKIDEVLLFFYPRNWREGETLWVPNPKKIPEMRKKFVSASRVISGPVSALSRELLSREICMTSLFIDRPEDTLMAYQHGRRSSFFTGKGVSKASGLREMAARLKLEPAHALGAGDTEMDTFLSEVGFAVIVGEGKLKFKGRSETVRVSTPLKLGELIMNYAMLLKATS